MAPFFYLTLYGGAVPYACTIEKWLGSLLESEAVRTSIIVICITFWYRSLILRSKRKRERTGSSPLFSLKTRRPYVFYGQHVEKICGACQSARRIA